MTRSHSFLLSLTLVIVVLSMTICRVVAEPDNVIWTLLLPEDRPPNCSLRYTRVAEDARGQKCLDADTRNDEIAWHSCITLPSGLLKTGHDYRVRVNYQVLDRPGEDAYFYIFARSRSLGYDADHWQKWNGQTATTGLAELRICPSADDYQIVVGIRNHGALRVRGLSLRQGGGWTALPLNGNVENGALSAPPIGAQPFTVQSPDNKNGAVINLADFGAVAGVKPGFAELPDRNLTALKNAIAKCREIKASKLIVPKGTYRITSGGTIEFENLNDFIFDGGGSTFLFDKIPGGPGISIKKCNRTIFRNFSVDWDWNKDPLASVGRIGKVSPDSTFFEMRFETTAPLDLKRWDTLIPLDETLRVPGPGKTFGALKSGRLEALDSRTVRFWPGQRMVPALGQLYLLRHHTYDKHCISLDSNSHLSLQNVDIFSFPGIGFIIGGDQHHFEFLHCRVTYPENERKSLTTTVDGFHIMQSQGFFKLEDCDFGYTGDDCVNIHDNMHMGLHVQDNHTIVARNSRNWRFRFAAGDRVEIRNGDFSPTGYSGTLTECKPGPGANDITMVFDKELPGKTAPDSILMNHRYGSNNYIIRNCYFHENRGRALLCNTASGLVEGNRFFHNQFSALHVEADVDPSWCEGFGASNIIIKNNKFESANSNGSENGAVVQMGAFTLGNPTRFPLLENILFEKNTFAEMPAGAFEVASFKNLTIRDNTFISTVKSSTDLKICGSIRAELGNGLWIEGNRWVTGIDNASPQLYFDSDTTQRITCKNNNLQH